MAQVVGAANKLPQRPRRPANSASSLVIHAIVVDRHRTTVRLEPEMWNALQDIAHLAGLTVNDVATDIDRMRTASSLTAAIRVYVVEFYRKAAFPRDKSRRS
jgi:predicted DNA-binding ribbon-helix-helix protein